jgi:hypothetical protein
MHQTALDPRTSLHRQTRSVVPVASRLSAREFQAAPRSVPGTQRYPPPDATSGSPTYQPSSQTQVHECTFAILDRRLRSVARIFAQIPASVSEKLIKIRYARIHLRFSVGPCGVGGIGRRDGLRSHWPKGRRGSNPLPRTRSHRLEVFFSPLPKPAAYIAALFESVYAN